MVIIPTLNIISYSNLYYTYIYIYILRLGREYTSNALLIRLIYFNVLYLIKKIHYIIKR